jgi:hypothetical protein
LYADEGKPCLFHSFFGESADRRISSSVVFPSDLPADERPFPSLHPVPVLTPPPPQFIFLTRKIIFSDQGTKFLQSAKFWARPNPLPALPGLPS